jgi:hypothetical protein
MRRVAPHALLAGGLLSLGAVMASLAVAQITVPPDDRFAGLQWTFARVKYNSYSGDARTDLRLGYWEEPWAIDAPAAEHNLSRRLATVTSIQVTDPVVVTLDDEKIFKYPWLYLVEPSNLNLNVKQAAVLREHLLRGGTLTLDDFHGAYEWDLTVRQLKSIFPDREIVELEPPHPIYTWINWNTDMGDGVEWSNAEEYPGYIKWTAQAYQMMINEVIYSLTH